MSPSTSSIPTRLTLLALFSATTFYCLYKYRRLKLLKKTLDLINPSDLTSPRGKVFFLSQTGTSKALAHRLHSLLASQHLPFDLVDPEIYEPEDLPKEKTVIIIASTWENGKPPRNGEFLANWVAESAEDFRVGSLVLSGCRFAVFGVGSRAYGETFNAVAKGLSKRMRGLGGVEVVAVGEGDVDDGELDGIFEGWSEKLIRVLKGNLVEEETNRVGESDVEWSEDEEEEEEEGGMGDEVVDLEDIAGKAPPKKGSGAVGEANGRIDGKKDMVTPVIRASLEKQVFWR